MNVILNNISNDSIKNIDIKEVLSVSNFIEKIYPYLDIDMLEPDNYYTIIFIRKKNIDKETIKGKLAYIYKDLNNEIRITLVAEERYLPYYIEKYCLKNLEIECRKNEGIPKSLWIYSQRESIAMGDDGPLDKKILVTPENRWSKIILNLPYYEYYKFVKVVYTTLDGSEEIYSIVENGELIVEDICFSKFIKLNKVDSTKPIIVKSL